MSGVPFYLYAQSSPPPVWYQPHAQAPVELGHRGPAPSPPPHPSNPPWYGQLSPVYYPDFNAQPLQPDYQDHQWQQQRALIQTPAPSPALALALALAPAPAAPFIVPQPMVIHNDAPQRHVFSHDGNQITLTHNEIAVDAMLTGQYDMLAHFRHAQNVDSRAYSTRGDSIVMCSRHDIYDSNKAGDAMGKLRLA